MFGECVDKQADYDVFVQGVEINPHPVIRSQPATFTDNAYTGILNSLRRKKAD